MDLIDCAEETTGADAADVVQDFLNALRCRPITQSSRKPARTHHVRGDQYPDAHYFREIAENLRRARFRAEARRSVDIQRNRHTRGAYGQNSERQMAI